MKQTKVLAGGVFNIVHPGHELFLKKAKALGDYLVVVIASDRTARRTKKYELASQEMRKAGVERLAIADKVVIGDERDFMKVVRDERPDIIALGHDQKADEKALAKLLAEEGIACKVIRIKEKLGDYKTSNIIKNKKN
ncbi:MAG: adenylyltransferase/cytidyltransferase family protein [Candidatus Aenigmatarchaeota archaeon]